MRFGQGKKGSGRRLRSAKNRTQTTSRGQGFANAAKKRGGPKPTGEKPPKPRKGEGK